MHHRRSSNVRIQIKLKLRALIQNNEKVLEFIFPSVIDVKIEFEVSKNMRDIYNFQFFVHF